MATLESINARIQRLRLQADALVQKDRSGAVAKVLKLMDQLGLTVADLPSAGARRKGGRKAAGGKKTVGAAKYRDPASGRTWTGHGRAPDWIKNAKNRDDYLIAGAAGDSEAEAAPARKRGTGEAAKAANGASRARRATSGKAGRAAGKAPAKKAKPGKSAGAQRARAANAAPKPARAGNAAAKAARASNAAAKAAEEPGSGED